MTKYYVDDIKGDRLYEGLMKTRLIKSADSTTTRVAEHMRCMNRTQI